MRFAFLALALSIIAGQAKAEPIDYFKVPGVSYDASVPTPDAFLGFGLGDKPVRHDMMIAYLRTLANASPRITSEILGYSHEGRPILGFVVTSPENHGRIDEIRDAHLSRLDPDSEDAESPVVVWLNYGVHGAESSGMDAAIPTLYHFAAAQGEEIEQTLANAVIVMVAIFNPDGHSRRVDHVYTFMSDAPVTDPNHAQHDLWIKARTNHYWFDLNRDWLLLTQPESRAWIDLWHRWKPNVSADFHEMGSDSTYYFHPGEPKRTHPLFPQRARDLLEAISKEHSAWLDSQRELYVSGEGFDNFYIGKGSTYPSVNGGVGILFEAAAARGGQIETENGVRTHARNVRLHFNTGLTTVRGAIRNAGALRAYQRDFFSMARREAREFPTKAFVFSTSGDEARALHFLKLLERHDIKAHRLARDLTLGEREFTAETSFVVPLNQPQYRLIRGMFDRITAFEEDVFYDVSGWTLPLAYDLNYAPLDGMRFNASLLGAEATTARFSKPAPEEASYGYMLDWADYYAPRALYALQAEGVITRVLTAPKVLPVNGETRRFNRGSIFIPLIGQTVSRKRIHELVVRAARRDGVDAVALDSGDVAGAGDLGARGSVRTLKKPKILLLFEDGVSHYSAGQIWHLLDNNMKIPTVLRQKDRLGGVNLADYTHIIAPTANGALFDEKMTARVADWVKAGGVFIATEDAARWAQQHLLSIEPVKDEEGEPEVERFDYAEKDIRDAQHLVAGAIFESDLDITHPLAFGYSDRSIATMRTTSRVLAPLADPVATVARYKDEPLLSGYASELRKSEIAGTPMLAALPLGRGTVAMFADDPSFRATFLGADKLFMNAIFFAPLVEASVLPSGQQE